MENDRHLGGSGRSAQGNGGHGAARERMPLDEIGQELSDELNALRERLEGVGDRAAAMIRERPGTSLLVALGAGYLIGRMLRS